MKKYKILGAKSMLINASEVRNREKIKGLKKKK